MTVKLANNARSTLTAAIDADATTATVAAGSRFPALADPGDWFPVVIGVGMTGSEVCRCTARNGGTLTIVRGAEGTLPRAWPVGALVELRLTAGALLGG